MGRALVRFSVFTVLMLPVALAFRSFSRAPAARRVRLRATKDKDLYRADRVLSQRTGKSRKECFKMLQSRRIFRQDQDTGILVNGPSTRIRMDTPLTIDQRHVVPLPPPLLCLYHKPKWVLSVRSDPHGRHCIENILTNLHPVGRLDYDTTGLLVFSSSGKLTQTLLHPKHKIEKEYIAVVTGTVNEAQLRRKLEEGVTTGEGIHTANLLRCEPVDGVRDYLDRVKSGLPDHYNLENLKERGYLDIFDAEALTRLTLTVSEGKHRMVRRMLNNAGHPVVSLHRERLGGLRLGDLPEGETRELTVDELSWAEQQVEGQKR